MCPKTSFVYLKSTSNRRSVMLSLNRIGTQGNCPHIGGGKTILAITRASTLASVAFRTFSGSRRKSAPLSSIRSKTHMNTSASWRRYRMRRRVRPLLALPSESIELK